MTEMLVGLGAFCVVAAAVGGGFKWAGAEMPVLKSTTRQLLLAVLGVAFGGLGFALDDGGTQPVVAEETTTTVNRSIITAIDPSVLSDALRTETTITLSRTSGPPGTVFRVSGSGFQPKERVEIRFHVEVLGEVRADDRGDFKDFETQVPASPFRNVQRTVSATGQSSVRRGDRPFQVT